MPSFIVTAPNGREFEVDAPDGASQEEVLAYAQQQFQSMPNKEGIKAAAPAEYDPQSPDYQAKYGAASGGGNFLAGAGKAFVDMGRGIGQLMGNVSSADVDEARRLDAPLMNTGAGRAGNLLGNVAATAPLAFVPGANTVPGALLLGGGLGASAPVGSDDSRLVNTGLGAAGGLAGKYLGDKLTGAIRGAPEAPIIANRGMRQKARELGFSLTPGQATGNKSLQKLEAAMESKSFLAAPIDRLKDKNQANLNRIVLEAIGEKGNKVTGEALDQADQRIGAVFDSVADDVPRKIDPDQFLDKLSELEAEVDGLVKGFSDESLVRQVIDLAGKGQATGKQLQGLGSKLGKAAYKQMSTPNGDRDLGMALYQVKDYMDDLLEQGMSPDRAKAFQTARQQYRALMLVTHRVGNLKAGNAKGGSIAATLQSKDKKGFLYGRNDSDLYNAARVAQEYAPIVGDSGTATRSQGLVDFLAAIPTTLGSYAYMNPLTRNLLLGAQYGGNAALRMTPEIAPRALPFGGALGAVNGFGQNPFDGSGRDPSEDEFGY